MSTIVNYYEELSLHEEMTVEEIATKLTQLEAVWNQRMFSEPEKANTILATITKAKEIFANNETKAQYDQELKKPEVPAENPSDDRREKFEKNYKTALDFSDKQQYDLAKASIDRALQFYDSADENDVFLRDIAVIYLCNNEFDTAVSYINQAIVINPTDWNHHYLKGVIFKYSGDMQKAYDSLMDAIDSARQESDKHGEEVIQRSLCDVFYAVGDYVSAEAAANESIKLGDPTGYSKQLLEKNAPPVEVTPSYIYYYKNEPCPYYEAINNLKNEIINNNTMITEGAAGWILCEHMYYFRESAPDAPLGSGNGMYTTHHKYLYTLDVDGSFKRYHSEASDWSIYSLNHESYELEQTYDDQTIDDFLREFDFYSYFDINNISYGDRVEYFVMNYPGAQKLSNPDYSSWHFSLKRLHKKGEGLLEKLGEIKNNSTIPSYYNPKDIQKQKEKEQKEQAYAWRQQGRCQHCGGEFKGMIVKKCVNCGKAKDY